MKTSDELLSSLFHFHFFFPLFSTKILPCINLFFSFILSSHYLYQFPFSSMKQKLTKNRIRFSDPTTTMLKHYFATFLCVYVYRYDPFITIVNGYLYFLCYVFLSDMYFLIIPLLLFHLYKYKNL